MPMTSKIEEQLAKTQKELAQVKAEYQEFVYVVSHDLRAPLRQIEGFAEIVISKHVDSFDEKTKHHFELITGGSAKARQLLDALVNYSRVETHAEECVPLNCNTLVDEVIKQLSDLGLVAKADISYQNLPDVIAEKNQISQLFYSLIHNALLYQLPTAHPKIVIQAEELEHEWQFCIMDNGIGVKDNVRDKIFTVLRRGVSDKKYSGMGMGLAMAKKILSRHGGDIYLKASSDEGSSFSFTLPKKQLNE